MVMEFWDFGTLFFVGVIGDEVAWDEVELGSWGYHFGRHLIGNSNFLEQIFEIPTVDQTMDVRSEHMFFLLVTISQKEIVPYLHVV